MMNPLASIPYVKNIFTSAICLIALSLTLTLTTSVVAQRWGHEVMASQRTATNDGARANGGPLDRPGQNAGDLQSIEDVPASVLARPHASGLVLPRTLRSGPAQKRVFQPADTVTTQSKPSLIEQALRQHGPNFQNLVTA